MKLRIWLLFFLLCSTSCRPTTTKEQDTLQGKVVSISDGDTFTMLLDNKTTVKVRLASIDCPERKQPYSAVATRFLSDAIFGNKLRMRSNLRIDIGFQKTRVAKNMWAGRVLKYGMGNGIKKSETLNLAF